MTRSVKRSVLKKLTGFAAVAILATSFTFAAEREANAQLSPGLQGLIAQIFATGGVNIIVDLAALVQANPGDAVDILIAGCSYGVDCIQLLAAISPFVDAELLLYLQAAAQGFDNTVLTQGGFDIIIIAEGGTENPFQTSGSEM